MEIFIYTKIELGWLLLAPLILLVFSVYLANILHKYVC
jgi:hypothetical protein